MKKITILLIYIFSISSFAQKYEKSWEKVIKLEIDNKTKSAFREVTTIYNKAVTDKNEVQIIKCFFYKSKYIMSLEEEAQYKIISNLEYEINKASIPSKALLNLVYAKCLNSYLLVNRYKLQKRTKLDSIKANDFLTWTDKDFEDKIEITYEETLENEEILKNTNLKNYSEIFDFFNEEYFNKSSLYNYLIQSNIDYYSTKIREWHYYNPNNNQQSRNLFSVSNEEFKKIKFDSLKDKNIKKILLLYQQFDYPAGLSEMELERLLFCNNYILKSDFNFLKKLDLLKKETSNEILMQRILFEKASIYNKYASKDKYPDFNIKAVACLDSVLTLKNRSNTFKKATLKQHQITLKELSIKIQKQSYENENTRAFISYKNIDKFDINFYKITSKFDSKDLLNDSIVNNFISKNKIYKSHEFSLKSNNDYFNYTTEVLLPKLELGSYLLKIENFDDKKAIYRIITISNSCVLGYENKSNSVYQVLDRKTGKPIENCQVKSNDFNLITDKEGIIQFDESKIKNSNYNYRKITIINKSDTLNLDGNYLHNLNKYENEEDEEIKAKVCIYLDRGIYRPGQTVYYKGIAIQNQNGVHKVIPNFLVHIIIEDANYSEIKSFDVTTNDFGSFNGEFILPKNGLTGEFTISAEEPENYENDALFNKIEEEHPIWDNGKFEYSEIRFSVEEYKRPKFEINFEPIKESYTLNDKITITGKAKSFAGSSISNAKVSYSINKRNYTNNDESFISSNTTTDNLGNFKIEFVAKADEDFEFEKNPTYYYTIKADITDNNGETHSAETNITIGKQSLKLDIKIPSKVISNEKNNILLNSTNLNNQFVTTNGELKLFFIDGFKRKFKKRVFEKPEINLITNEDFEKLFPNENNQKINEENTVGTLVFSKKINTSVDKSIALDFISNYKSGYYKLVFTANDKSNNNIETKASFELYQINDKQSFADELITIQQLNKDPKKDGYVLVQINSAVPELYLSSYGVFDSKVFFEKSLSIENNKTELKIPIQKEIKNVFKIGLETVYDNQRFIFTKDVLIIEDTPKITIETETFRNKLEPGKNENWSFIINEDGQKFEFEALASMYDSSLDQFKSSYWNNLISQQYYRSYFSGKTAIGFETIEFFINNFNYNFSTIEFQNESNQLMWFGFDFNNKNNQIVTKEYKKQITKKARKPINAKTIYGFITDGKLPLPGANIVIKGTTRGVSSDMDGYFEIEAAPGETLIFSFVGYENKIITVNEAKSIKVSLKEDETVLNEVVVGAMGIKRSKDATVSAQKQIGFKELVQSSNPNAIQTLLGKISGVQINTTGVGENSNVKISLRGNKSIDGSNDALIVIDGKISDANTLAQMPIDSIIDLNIIKGAQGAALYGSQGANGVVIVTTTYGAQEMLTTVKTRTNRNETAFFYPNLKTDANGKIHFSFKSPEELTQWKFRLLAHKKDATMGYIEKSVITQKELMIVPNMPRFFRESDTIEISAKVSNLTSSSKIGTAILQLFDATTMENIDSKTFNLNSAKNFTITPTGNTIMKWKITIPQGIQGIQYKLIAKADNFSDGEESVLPVLTNNILVTESIPIWVRENSKKEYSFDNLKNNISNTLTNHQFVLEYTSNPTWIAIQSLPYLMEYEHECAEQTFARYYANVLATKIINSNPKIGKVFEDWKNSGKPVSKLDLNEELKSLILAETPWINDIENEEEKKKKLALLFDLENMKTSSNNIFNKLKEKQRPSGGFAWFDGGTENEYITTHIVAGLGHLQILKTNNDNNLSFKEINNTALPYLDTKYLERNINIEVKNYKNNPYEDLHYLYARSFYLDSFPISEKVKLIINKQLKTIKSNWHNYTIYNKGLASLVLNRFDEKFTAKKIIESLKENSSNNEDLGMYWIENTSGWNWYQAPIETQALLIEAFSEINNDSKSVDEMKVWLLKSKQTKNWPTTKSTTEAIYALLLQGKDWLSIKDNTIFNIGDKKIMTRKLSENEKEAETGYIKMAWKSNEITKEMASISIQNKTDVPGYGGVYWQYFEDLDKIKTNIGSLLSTTKELFIKKNTAKGEELQRITAENTLKLGDLVTVRLVITTKEDLEFIHLKDMRASCFEPVNVLSEYKWNDGLGYYLSTKDAATHFFFDKINKGTYVIEYDIRVNNIGDFSNGITTIQSMYAPEYTSHTKGLRVIVNE
ncbi:alpha-2-macroglobulin family protein [Flavobacterium chungnamense]|uniref:Alpha-2-macroglobulin domain-containing protein n=1 Tax=Flavobacterium chungnamense TaxID=706182 RepID=A0ABP7UJ55_9FLAO